MKVEKVVDARGLSCPMPIVKTKKAMDELKSGQVLEVHATDKGSVKDLSAWAETSGNELLEHKEDNGVYKFLIKKG